LLLIFKCRCFNNNNKTGAERIQSFPSISRLSMRSKLHKMHQKRTTLNRQRRVGGDNETVVVQQHARGCCCCCSLAPLRSLRASLPHRARATRADSNFRHGGYLCDRKWRVFFLARLRVKNGVELTRSRNGSVKCAEM